MDEVIAVSMSKDGNGLSYWYATSTDRDKWIRCEYEDCISFAKQMIADDANKKFGDKK